MLWYIIAGILLLLLLLLFIPLSLTVSMSEDGAIRLCGRVLGFAVYRSPKKERPFNPRHYTPRAIKRRERTEQRKLRRKQRRAAHKEKSKKQDIKPTSHGGKDMSLTETISLVRDIAATVLHRSLKHARVNVERLAITVATPDAAQTAILYGGVCAALAALTEILHNFSHLRIRDAAHFGVAVDYTSERCRADVRIRFTLRVHHVIRIAIRTVLRAVGHTMKHK